MVFLFGAAFGQPAVLKITKIKGTYQKSIKLPANTRIVKHNGDLLILSIDSIANGYFYGNKGKDSIALSDIKLVNQRGVKEFVKYTAVATGAAITLAATIFTISTLAGDANVCDGNCNNDRLTYAGLGYMGFFGLITTGIYLYPKTRFKTNKYTFKTE